MNKGVLTVGIILLSVIALVLLNVMTSFSTGGELDYYLVKETTDAAMEDAIDYVFLRTCGLYRIDKEKFAESFVYRFANSVDGNRGYRIQFYDINEVPPKVSVKVDSTTSVSATSLDSKRNVAQGDISTSYDAILETNTLSNISVEEGLRAKQGEKSYKQCLSLLETQQ